LMKLLNERYTQLITRLQNTNTQHNR
jgi:hypothetical protein